LIFDLFLGDVLRRFFITFLLTGCSVLPSFGQKAVWPTDASTTLTSSFGEYRFNHIHGGIDVKTWGQAGYKALAIDSGSVVRVGTSPYGYGRIVYFKTQTNLIAVYAHLSRFAPFIETRVRAEQKRLGRFAVDVSFTPGQLVFRKGETLAYTGSTGTGVPHLHFELRDSENRLINPLTLGYEIQDNLVPLLSCLSVTPLCAGSHVDGDFMTKRITLVKTGRKSYRMSQAVTCWGDVGLSLSGFDMVDGCPNRLGLYRVKMVVDGVDVFKVQYERFPFEQIREIDMDTECRLNRRGLGVFYKLYKEVENTLTFHNPDLPGAGILCSSDENGGVRDAVVKPGSIVLMKGDHTIKIEASDYSGNTTEVVGRLLMVPLAEAVAAVRFPGNGWTGGVPGKIRVPRMELDKQIVDATLVARLEFDAPVSEIPRITVRVNAVPYGFVPLVPKSTREFVGQMLLSPSVDGTMVTEVRFLPEAGWEQSVSDTARIFHVSPETGGVMTSSDGVCKVVFPPGSVYKSIWGTIKTEADLKRSPDRLGKIYSVIPDDFPLKNPIQVFVDASSIRGEKNKTAVFAKRFGAFSFQGKERRGDAVAAWLPALMPVTLVRDTVPPVLLRVRPGQGLHIRDKKTKIAVRFYDGQTGVSGEENYTVSLDSTRLIMEYIPVALTAFAIPDEPLKKGKHMLDILIRDRVGNTTSTQSTFFVE
jgi:hypothetical protein